MVKNSHSKRAQAAIGIGAAATGIILGMLIVFLNGATGSSWGIPQVQAGNEECVGNSEQYGCPYPQQKKKPDGTTIQCMFDKTCTNVTNGHTTQGGCQAPGKCFGKTGDGKKLEGKPKDMGGMPPMLPMLPMPMPKMPMPTPPQQQNDECKEHPTSTDCQRQGGVGGFLNNLFGTSDTNTSGTANTVQNTIRSAADTLWSFVTGDTNEGAPERASKDTASTQMDTAANSPFSASSGGNNPTQLNAQSGGTNNSNTQVSGLVPTSQVTGFGASGGGQPQASSGFLNSIGQTLSAITVTLRNMLANIF